MNYALIMISGIGKRLGEETPKQFLLINKKPIYYYCLKTFYFNKNIDHIVLVTHPSYLTKVKEDIESFGFINKPIDVISGDKERHLSVYKGLNYLSSININDNDNVLIHDGVRPNLDSIIIDLNVAELKNSNAVLTAIKADSDYSYLPRVDTLHSINNEYYRAQTPQSFHYKNIKDQYEKYINLNPYPYFDEASLFLVDGLPIKVIIGSHSNYKITNKNDLELFKKQYEEI